MDERESGGGFKGNESESNEGGQMRGLNEGLESLNAHLTPINFPNSLLYPICN